MTRSMNDKLVTLAGRLLVTAILIFVMLPTVVVFISSFSSTAVLFFPPKGWSLRWFERALSYDDFRHGFYSGLIVTAWASSLAVMIGATLAIAIERYSFPCKQVLEGILLSPLFIPHFTIGLGLLMLVSQLNLGRGYPLVIFCHIVLVLPVVRRSVHVSLKNLEQRIELAAASLGASPLLAFRRVTLPLSAPGVISGALFAFATSFDEVVVTLFLAGPEQATLPRQMFSGIRENLSPTIAAAATLLIAFSVVLLLTLEWLRGRSEKLRTQQPA